MDVRHERGGPPALTGDSFQNNRSGFCDCNSAKCHGRVEAVEFCRREIFVDCNFEAVWKQMGWQVFGDKDAVAVMVL